MDRGNIIYLVAIVVFLLSSLLKRRKRPANQQQQQPEPILEHTEVEDFDDWFMKDEPQQVIPTPIQTVPMPAQTFVSEQKADRKVSERPRQQPKFTEPVRLSDNINNNSIETINIELNTPEDARRAFIYSEIFQRKY
jgi:hypothetical protein